jgi:hypothetical protein
MRAYAGNTEKRMKSPDMHEAPLAKDTASARSGVPTLEASIEGVGNSES